MQDDSPLFNLLSELHLSDFESQHLLRQLSDKDRTLAAFLRAQNKRLDLLSAVVAQTLLGEVGQPVPVVLSEGGIEFAQATQVAPGTRVKVKMVLMPRAHGLLLRGKVTHCDPRPAGGFEVGTEFIDMTDAQRQLLLAISCSASNNSGASSWNRTIPPHDPVFSDLKERT